MTDGLTVGSVIANAARATPDATAAVIGGIAHSFGELDQAGDLVAHNLGAEGLQLGEVAIAVGPTSFEMLALFVGCARAGVVFVPANAGLDHGTLAALGETIQPAAVLAAAGMESLAEVFGAPCRQNLLRPVDTDARLPAVTGADAHIAFLTSGSTGVPKAALLSHRTSVLRSHPGAQLEPRGAALCPYPLFHMAGWTISMQQWHARASVVFVEGTDAATLTDALQTHRIERFNAIPALWTRLAEHVDGDGAFPDLRFADTGTSPTSVELLETITKLAPNAHVRVFYGSSEAGNVASLHHDDLLVKPGSCGQPSVLTTIEIGDDGELLVAGPLLFEGYLGNPDATAAALHSGWYRTGDRAELDDEGYLSIVGRLGTVIRSGGESIDPAVVEAALSTHPAIDAVAVFGVPDEAWGEVVTAAVVANAAVSLEDLAEHLADHPKHHRPRRLLVVDEIPRTAATGQVDRHRLRQAAQADDGATP